MKYVRNSRNKQQQDIKTTAPTIPGVSDVTKRLQEDIEWVEQLQGLDQFSSDWVHKVAVELLMQCMGKKSIVMGFKGEEKEVRVFKEKHALKTLEMISKMNGHLFDVVKRTLTRRDITPTDEESKTIELQPNVDRTSKVFEILENCGALQPGVKQINPTEVEQVYSA
jgi:hypothetical protein